MIRRSTAAVTLGAVAWLVLAVPLARAQAPEPPPTGAEAPTDPGSHSIAVDLTGAVDPAVDQGVLVRGTDATGASLVAVYVGLSVVGATLAAITVRRRYLAVEAAELATGVVVGRRHRAEFWTTGPHSPPTPAPDPAPRRRPRWGGRPAVAMLVGSGDAVAVTEHGPTVRAGFAGGASDG